MRKLLAFLAFALLTAGFARAAPDQSCNAGEIKPPDGVEIVCSNTWRLNGTCSGNDMWDQWEIGGEPNPEGPFIRPWTNAPIRVIGYELVKLQAGDNDGVWHRAAVAIRAAAEELGQALRNLSVIARDFFTLNWNAIGIDHASGFDRIAAIQAEAEKSIGVARYSNERQSWFMIGSGIHSQPDAMLWLAPGETHSLRLWPAGTGQIWPSKAGALHSKYEDILDVHGLCFGGGPVKIFLTIYYTPLNAPNFRKEESPRNTQVQP